MKYHGGIIKIAVLLVLFPIILGKSTFSKTIQLSKDYKRIKALEEQLVKKASSPQTFTPLPSREESIISDGRIVVTVDQACKENNVSIKQYEPRLLDSEGDYKLYSANLLLSGNYVDLIRTLKYMEDNMKTMKISTLTFNYDEKKMKDKKVEMSLSFMQVE
ncbi:MAG: hypothetical protein QM305_02445 [Bacteroidota bacterium]|nr:hypothetical protein [Bacteroidota bacterium]